MIEVKNLTKKYGSQVCLDNVCLSLEEGRIYGMVGENGAGKSNTPLATAICSVFIFTKCKAER